MWQPATLSAPTPPKQDTIALGKAKKRHVYFKNIKVSPNTKKTYDLGGINGPLLRGWNPVTHEDRSLRAGAPGLGEPRMSGEAGYLSPASPLVPQVLSISLIGLGRVATLTSRQEKTLTVYVSMNTGYVAFQRKIACHTYSIHACRCGGGFRGLGFTANCGHDC